MTPMDFRGARSMESPSALARMISTPRRRLTAHVDVAAPAAEVWQIVRHENLLRTLSLRSAFRLMSYWTQRQGVRSAPRLCLDDLMSTPERPSIRVFSDEPPLRSSLGVLMLVRGMRFECVHASSIEEFAAFDAPGFVKLGWYLELLPLGVAQTRLRVELRLGADEKVWRSLRWSFACVKPLLDWAHRQVLGSLADHLGWPRMVRARPATAGGFTLPNF